MTDIHSHIIFNVDDGSKSIEESIEILKSLRNIGFDNVIMTPHFIEATEYKIDNKEKIEKLKKISNELKYQNIDIKAYLGNEIFINNNIVDYVKKGLIYPLNNTKYLLIELPFHNKIVSLMDLLYEIKIEGYIPVIAHPERYTYFHEDYSLVDELKGEGVLFQCNYSSVIGSYGKEAEKLMKYMLKNHYVDYLGTDIHHSTSSVFDKFNKIERKIIKYAGKDNYETIKNNCDNLVK